MVHFGCSDGPDGFSSLYSSTIDELVAIEAESAVHANVLMDLANNRFVNCDITFERLPGLTAMISELGAGVYADVVRSLNGSAPASARLRARNIEVEVVADEVPADDASAWVVVRQRELAWAYITTRRA